jgi:tripeptidyl-peptidase I
MRFSIFTVAGGLLTTVSCAPATNYVVHEKRQAGDSTWLPRDVEIDSRTVLPFSIGLTQQNLHKGHDFLMDVSDPNSPNYANHWTPAQVWREGLGRVLFAD